MIQQSERAALSSADMVVFAAPIYWFDISAQLKLAIDRMYAFGGCGFNFSKVALLLNSGAEGVLRCGHRGVQGHERVPELGRYRHHHHRRHGGERRHGRKPRAGRSPRLGRVAEVGALASQAAASADARRRKRRQSATCLARIRRFCSRRQQLGLAWQESGDSVSP